MLFQDLLQNKENPNDRLFSSFAYRSDKGGFPNHCHLHMEMVYQLRGFGSVVIDGRSYELHMGDLVFVPMLSPHAFADIIDVNSIKLILQISPKFMGFGSESAEFIRRLQFGSMFDGLHCSLAPDSRARSLLDELGRECDFYRNESSAMLSSQLSSMESFAALCRINGLIFLVIDELLRSNVLAVASEADSAVSIHEIERLVPVLERMVANPEHRFTLQEAAQMASMGYSSFSRTFRRAVGQNYVDYQNMLRVRIAEEMLRRTDQSIMQIADYTNFGSQSYFNRVFKQINGVSPSAYRRGVRAK